MSSPLSDKLDELVKKDFSSFHTPGHKGIGTVNLKYDITELDGFESLYEGVGAISNTEKQLSEIYGCKTVLSASGSTLCIQTMIAMAVPSGGKIISARGVHLSAVNAMALLDLDPFWVYQDIDNNTGLIKAITAEQVEKAIKECLESEAVYLTSPDYYGQNADIEKIANVCKKYGKKLLVDAAHGSHYKFLNPSIYPLDLGADICCASLHKTLPSMTGAAILSMKNNYTTEQAKKYMGIFGSTSPSYLIMLSADKLIPLIKNDIEKRMGNLIKRVEKIYELAVSKGFAQIKGNIDPTRIVLGFGELGYERKDFLELLHKHKIEPEYTDSYYCVLIPTVNSGEKDFERVEELLSKIEKKSAINVTIYEFPKLEKVMAIREAVFRKSLRIQTKLAKGRIVSNMIIPCPPGVPLAMPGERLNDEAVDCLEKHGVLEIDVI